MFRKGDEVATAALVALPSAIVAAAFLMGRCVYWGDLTYIHHPWRTLVSEYVQRGMLPLWNPYAYLGMPLAAEMQCAAWYPGSVLFYVFPFEGALALFHALHFGLVGVFSFLWLRKEGLKRTAALAGAVVFMGNGVLASRIPFLNHLSCLAFVPALLLMRRSRWLLGLACALCFLGGYPTILAGGAAAASALPWLAGGGPEGRRSAWKAFREWPAAAALAAGLGACLLLPAASLAARSQRMGGLDLSETLRFAFASVDWRRWISPLLDRGGEFSAATSWWKTCYLGFAAWIAVFSAAKKVKPGVLAGLAAYIGTTMLLSLGDSTRPSLWLWSHWAPLHYIRYPGNLAFLAVPAFVLLASAGLQGRSWSGVAAAVIAVELGVYGAFSQPTAARGFYSDAGPLARQLQASLGGHRYLLSGRSMQLPSGSGETEAAGVLDWRHRLYGMSNVPFHLSAAGNFGEPLVPKASYDYMDFLYRRPNLDALTPYLPWGDVRLVLTRDRLPARALDYRGRNLWHEYRAVPDPTSRAVWFDDADGAALPAALREGEPFPDFRRGKVLEFSAPREDRYRVEGGGNAGWLYVAEPREDGWRCRLNGAPVRTEPAFGAFQKLRVPTGNWRLGCAYDPPSWMPGVLATALVLLASSAYWYNRILAALHEFHLEPAGG